MTEMAFLETKSKRFYLTTTRKVFQAAEFESKGESLRV